MTDTTDEITANMLKIMRDSKSPAAARVAAANQLNKASAIRRGGGLGEMSREEIAAELAECKRQLGRTP